MNSLISQRLSSLVPQKKGLLKLTVCQATINQQCSSGKLQIKIDQESRIQQMNFTDKKAEIWNYIMYGIHQNASISLQLKLSNGKIGWAQFSIQKLCAIPKVRHQVDIILVQYNIQQNHVKVPLTQIGSINIQFLFIKQHLGKLHLTMIQAQLTRNTQAIGQMDPYVILSIDGVQQKTGVRDQQGKHPIWNSKFQFQINNVDAKLKLTVMDKDNVRDDVVGWKQISLLKEGFLYPTKNLKTISVNILFNDQSAGILSIQHRFQLTGQ